jgi:hypothetical protein
VFGPALAGAADFAEYHQVFAASLEVDRPEEPPATCENVVGRLHNPFPGFGPVVHWVARHEGSIVTAATASTRRSTPSRSRSATATSTCRTAVSPVAWVASSSTG